MTDPSPVPTNKPRPGTSPLPLSRDAPRDAARDALFSQPSLHLD